MQFSKMKSHRGEVIHVTADSPLLEVMTVQNWAVALQVSSPFS